MVSKLGKESLLGRKSQQAQKWSPLTSSIFVVIREVVEQNTRYV